MLFSYRATQHNYNKLMIPQNLILGNFFFFFNAVRSKTCREIQKSLTCLHFPLPLLTGNYRREYDKHKSQQTKPTSHSCKDISSLYMKYAVLKVALYDHFFFSFSNLGLQLFHNMTAAERATFKIKQVSMVLK